MASRYEIARYQTGHKEQVLRLLQHLWGRNAALNRAYFEWKYEASPYIPDPAICLALHPGEVVGMYGILGARWQLGTSGRRQDIPLLDDLRTEPGGSTRSRPDCLGAHSRPESWAWEQGFLQRPHRRSLVDPRERDLSVEPFSWTNESKLEAASALRRYLYAGTIELPTTDRTSFGPGSTQIYTGMGRRPGDAASRRHRRPLRFGRDSTPGDKRAPRGD